MNNIFSLYELVCMDKIYDKKGGEDIFTFKERIGIIEALENHPVKSVIRISFTGPKGYIYNYCPYCNIDCNKTPSNNFTFTVCHNCDKTFKNF